ncbi:hypothetical protein DV735_g719, partial [Chaetothyriales sp. CBS 134920]
MDSPELESAWIIVGGSESHADEIKAFEANKDHIISYESGPLHDRETTPFGEEPKVYLGLRPRKKPVYFFGTVDEHDAPKADIHFQLASKKAGLRLRVSEEQFCLEFNQHGSWMLVDQSSNGTWVDQDLAASNKARGLAVARQLSIKGNFRRIALHPERWSLITAGKLQFHLKVGKDTPRSFVAERDELAMDDFHVQSNPTSSAALTPSSLLQPAFVDHVGSWQFHFTENISPRLPSGMKVLVHKSTGQKFMGEVYAETPEQTTLRVRYEALTEILKEGREKNLIPFLESTVDGGFFIIISEYWPATSLNVLIDEELTPDPLELSFVFAQMIQAISYLHSKGIMHRSISPESIFVARGSPVISRLGGFSEAISATCATEVVGHPDFRAPEMTGTQEYGYLIDVFSLSKVIQHCLAIQEGSNILMDSIVQKGLAVDPVERPSASQIQKEIDSTADGDYEWPFKSVTLRRRFKVTWFHEWNDTYIRLSDLYQLILCLADPYNAKAVPPVVKAKYFDDVDFPGQYCRLVYGTRLFDACGLRNRGGILKPRTKRIGNFSEDVDLSFNLYYHAPSQMFNVTTLLQTAPLDLARVATWDLQSQVQEVHGDAEWEGNYIDRRSFEQVLERVQQTQKVTVPLGNIEVQDRRAHTRFGAVDYAKEVIVVTKWASPPWVTLTRMKGETSLDNMCFGSQDELREWCTTSRLHGVLDRVNITIRPQPIPQDWKIALSADARILLLPGPRDGKRTRFLFCPTTGLYEFTKQDASFLVATPINLLFFLLPLLPSTLVAANQGGPSASADSGPDSSKREREKKKIMFQPLDDILEARLADDAHLRYLLEHGRPLVDAAVAQFEDKVVQVLYASVSAVVLAGGGQRLPASMEERFVARALEAPVLGMKRETQPDPPPHIVQLMRVKVALDFILASYFSPDVGDYLGAKILHDKPKSTPSLFPDFTPLHDHLKHIAALKAEAAASRSLGDFTRKRVACSA